jgi:hypothetical protein
MITINAGTIKQPTGLREYKTYVRSEKISLKGNRQRSQLNTKKVAELTWTSLTPSELSNILAWADPGAAVAYANSSSSRYGSWSFNGLPTITDEGSYERGGSYRTDTFTIIIEEV